MQYNCAFITFDINVVQVTVISSLNLLHNNE